MITLHGFKEHIDSFAMPCFTHQPAHQFIDGAVKFMAGQRGDKVAHFVSGWAISHHPTLAASRALDCSVRQASMIADAADLRSRAL